MVLRFSNNKVKRDCCDTAQMRKLWGPELAYRISHRLQQLEAMTTLADLGFLPFDWWEHPDGTIEVAVADDLSLFLEPGPVKPNAEAPMHTATIVGLSNRSTKVGGHDARR